MATPRLVLLMSTTTTPATAIRATLSQVTLAGGAARPPARRRVSRMMNRAPARTTRTIMTIQLAAGLSAPPSMSDSTLLYSRIVPPPFGAAASMTNSRMPRPASWPARVTTKDGSRSRVMSRPWAKP